MIINNRIQLFLYQNAIPTGLNYESGMLLSTVYFKGAEYPHIDIFNLPNYVGKSRDSLTKNMSGIEECQEKFNQNYCGFEKNLESIQYSIDKADENWVDDLINCLLTWARTFGALLGINLLSEAFEYILESGLESEITATIPVWLTARIAKHKEAINKQYTENQLFNDQLKNRIEYLEDTIEEITGQLLGRNGEPPKGPLVRRVLVKYREQLIVELRNLRTQIRPLDYLTAALEQETQEIQRLVKQYTKSGTSGVSGVLNKAKVFISKFFSKIQALLGTLAAGLGRVLPWVALSVLIYANTKLYQCFTAACEKRLRKVRDLEQVDRYNAANLYYDTMEAIFKSGCCDNGSGSGSGSGSDIQGVGLTLLMGNKYIPTYYDNINENYLNTNVEATPGVNGWKPNCPPQFDCLTCGLTRTPADNRWKNCTDKPITSSLGIPIPNHTCACGWKKEPSIDPCDIGDILNGALGGILSLVRSIPGIIDGVLDTGGAIGDR